MQALQNGDEGSTPFWPASTYAGMVASSSMVERREIQYDQHGLSDNSKPTETSSVWLEHSFQEADVTGSTPVSQIGGELTGELALPFISKRKIT